MSPRTKDQFNDMRESAQQKIMDAALDLFANVGYYPTSISQIAKKAGISKGLMYNYFESKESLLREIVFRGVDSFTESFDPNRDGILTKDELILFIRESFKLVRKHRDYWKLYFSLMMQSSVLEVFADEFELRVVQLMNMLTNYFREQNNGNPEVEMRFFIVTLEGIAMNFVMDPADFPLDKMEQRLIELYSK